MLDNETKRRIDTARDILVGKVPDPKSQVEQITIALIYKFMSDMDAESEELGGTRKFFTGEYEKYSWHKLMAPDMGGYDVLNLYSESIQKMNFNQNIPQLFRDIFKNAYLPYRDPETLKSFLKIINDFDYDHSEKLGDAFEYLLYVLGSQGDAGQFRTPRHIIEFMVNIIEPKKNETILDPACGTAGFLISSYKHIAEKNSKNDKNGANLTPDDRNKLADNIIGYDISPDMVRLSLVNMHLHGFRTPNIFEYDTLTSEDRWNEYFDIVLANPPFMSPKGGIKPHKRFSVQSNRSEVLFVDYIAEHLAPTGRAAVIVPEGIIFQSQNAYKQLRKMLIEKCLYAVVSLPAGVFKPYSNVKTSILLMDKNIAKRTDKILFIKIENDGFDLGAQRREIKQNDIPQSLSAIKDYCNSIYSGNNFDIDIYSNLSLVEKTKIAENGEFSLIGDRYKTLDYSKNKKYKYYFISDLCELGRGRVISKNEIEENIGEFPVFSSQTTNNGILGYSNTYDFEGKYATWTTDGANAGTVFYRNGKFNCTNVCGTLKSKNENILNMHFLSLILNSIAYKYVIRLGNPKLMNKEMAKIKIPLPPLEIQKEIVAEIEEYQKIIDGAKQVVENYKPRIEIDPDWEKFKMEKICLINDKTAEPVKLFGNTTFTYIDISSIENGTGFITYDNVIKTETAPSRARRIIKENDILLSTVRPYLKAFGFLERLPEKCLASTGFAVLTTLDTILPKFLYYLLFTDYVLNQMIDRMGKGAYPSINQKDVSELLIPVPPIEIQKTLVYQLEIENKAVSANKELIKIFEKKINDKIEAVWKK